MLPAAREVQPSVAASEINSTEAKSTAKSAALLAASPSTDAAVAVRPGDAAAVGPRVVASVQQVPTAEEIVSRIGQVGSQVSEEQLSQTVGILEGLFREHGRGSYDSDECFAVAVRDALSDVQAFAAAEWSLAQQRASQRQPALSGGTRGMSEAVVQHAAREAVPPKAPRVVTVHHDDAEGRSRSRLAHLAQGGAAREPPPGVSLSQVSPDGGGVCSSGGVCSPGLSRVTTVSGASAVHAALRDQMERRIASGRRLSDSLLRRLLHAGIRVPENARLQDGWTRDEDGDVVPGLVACSGSDSSDEDDACSRPAVRAVSSVLRAAAPPFVPAVPSAVSGQLAQPQVNSSQVKSVECASAAGVGTQGSGVSDGAVAGGLAVVGSDAVPFSERDCEACEGVQPELSTGEDFMSLEELQAVVRAPDGLFVLYLCAGEPRARGFEHFMLSRSGGRVRVLHIDVARGGRAHDMRSRVLAYHLCFLATCAACIGVLASPPCATCSPAVWAGPWPRPRRRWPDECDGIRDAQGQFHSRVAGDNLVYEHLFIVLQAAEAAGKPCITENSVCRRPGSTFAMKGRDQHAFLWDTSWALTYMSLCDSEGFDFEQCPLGSLTRKATRLHCSRSIFALAFARFGHLRCTHPRGTHPRIVNVGQPYQTAQCAAYPERMDELLSECYLELEGELVTGGDSVTVGERLHVGSARPHESDGDAFAHGAPAQPDARAGSLRQLEAEDREVLLREPLPLTNVILRTDPEEPPERHSVVPGPFTDAELLPPGVYEEVVAYGREEAKVIARAERGTQGWRVAKKLRPEARTWTEEEALNPCGRGFRWHKQADGLWHAIQPSQYPMDPPSTSMHIAHFEELADRWELTDHQLRSWIQHGMPGSPSMPVFAQVAPVHVGALQHAAIFRELADRDAAAGYVSSGFEFPDVWPCVVDPMNIVVQNGKGRMTIDKTMLVCGDPELPSYNLTIELDVHERGKRYTLVRVWMLSRASAIFDSVAAPISGVETRLVKLDLKAFFRRHGKQRAFVHQSGRLTCSGYGTDWCVNFGERDAPDHTGRSSNALCHFMRCELKRLELEYPTVVPELQAWLAFRASIRPEHVQPADDFVYSVLFFILFYVDDAGAAIVNDPLHRRDGTPVVELVTLKDGTQERQHRQRAWFYFEAMIGVAEYVGHQCPLDKRVYPARELDFLGIGVSLPRWLRYLSDIKGERYAAQLHEVVSTARPLRGTPRRVLRKEFNQLVHRLLHASEVMPLGRSHLFHCLLVLREVNRLDGSDLVLSDAALRELAWWQAALADVHKHGVPLASRSMFPSASDPTLLTHYGDASREYDDATRVMAASSGFGSWTVLAGVFYYVEGRWSTEECAAFSINVLELATEAFGAVPFVARARELGLVASHVHTFVDNTCAENVSERGRTHSAGINQLNQRRQQWLVEQRVYQRTSRVASVFNDVADLLSRGDVDEALRFPREAGLECVRLQVPHATRDLSGVSPTWA